MHVDEIAILGGSPLFSSPKPIGQLASPPPDALFELLKRSYDGGFSRNAAISAELERRLAAYHGTSECVVVANAGLALMMLMRIFAGDRRGTVIMPAFSYRGLPHFAQWAGQMPRFCDVEETTHGLDPKSADAAIDESATAILAVSNVNSACDIEGLSEVARRRGVPIFFDSVYALGSTHNGKPLGGFGRAEVFSLHATKLLNGFEGGYVTTDDPDIGTAFRRLRNSGRTNVWLNEVHAAMALACFDGLESVISRNRDRYDAYASICAATPGLALLPYRNEASEKYNYEMAIVEVREPWPLTRDETVAVLRAEAAAITSYYSPPLHRSPHAPAGMPVPELPVSEDLARRYLQLPVGELISIDDIHRLGELLGFVSQRGDEIAKRIRKAAR